MRSTNTKETVVYTNVTETLCTEIWYEMTRLVDLLLHISCLR